MTIQNTDSKNNNYVKTIAIGAGAGTAIGVGYAQTRKSLAKSVLNVLHYDTFKSVQCITANPNYNEQAFIANGTPIRLKFKTKNPDGSARMEFFDRIGTLKSDHSVYRIFGYNFDDIDWTQTCIATADGWENISKHV